MERKEKIEKEAAEEFNRWSQSGRAEAMERGHRSMTTQFLDTWSFAQQDCVLDIGCGNGWAVREMLQRGAKLGFGVDISPKMVERAKSFAASNEQYFESTAESLPFEDASFDKILSVESLYYYSDPSKALKEWFRVAKENSQLAILIDLFEENEGSHCWVDALPIHAHLLSIEHLYSMLAKAGWGNIQHSLIKDHRPLKTRAEFKPDPYWPTYEQYLRFKEIGSLALSATK